MLCEVLCKAMRDRWDMAVITNDIYTKEDQRLLTVAGALLPERIMGVETGGCPHTAIREDASINLAAVRDMTRRFPGLELLLIESGGDNLAATFSPELADLTIYVIDVAGGEKIPQEGRPGHHPLGPAGDQQDRSGADGRGGPRRDGSRHAAHARRAAVRDGQPARRRRDGGGDRLHRTGRRAGARCGVADAPQSDFRSRESRSRALHGLHSVLTASSYAHAMKVDISPERQAWLESEIAKSGSRSPAQVVDAALHAYEHHLADLRRDIAEADRALEAGEAIAETASEFLMRMRLKHPRPA